MHNAGIAHCDIKPANVLLEESDDRLVAIVTDFGISLLVDESETAKVSGFSLSTLKGASVMYAAPEVLLRIKKRIPDEKTPNIFFRGDSYGLSLTIYQMLIRSSPWTLGVTSQSPSISMASPASPA